MRINIVPVKELTDQHLRAEYLEIALLSLSLVRTLKSKGGFDPSKVPASYTLNSGHAYFFFDKGKYLHRRYGQIVREMKKRGFKPARRFPTHYWPRHLYRDWSPSEKDFGVIRQRIAEKVILKPDWYRYYREPLAVTKLFKVLTWL